jgi:predicted transcriptional regulator
MTDEELEIENQRRVYAFVLGNPGQHLRRISRDLGMQLGTLRYHLDQLERRGLVVSKDERNLRTYFAASKLSVRDQRMASLLQQKRFRDIIVTIMASPGATQSVMGEMLGLRTSTLSKYIMILEDRGVVYHDKDGRENRYRVTDEDWVTRLLLTYRSSFWDPYIDNALELYFEQP